MVVLEKEKRKKERKKVSVDSGFCCVFFFFFFFFLGFFSLHSCICCLEVRWGFGSDQSFRTYWCKKHHLQRLQEGPPSDCLEKCQSLYLFFSFLLFLLFFFFSSFSFVLFEVANSVRVCQCVAGTSRGAVFVVLVCQADCPPLHVS